MRQALIILLLKTAALSATSLGIITSKHYYGEREVAWRTMIAAQNLGWDVLLDEEEGRLTRHTDLDYVICTLPDARELNSRSINLLTIFHPFNYLDENRNLLEKYGRYDGFLVTINDQCPLQEETRLWQPFYPTIYSTPYQTPPLKDLVIVTPAWSNRLTDLKFRQLYRLLESLPFVKFYGGNFGNLVEKNYLGSIPFDGQSIVRVLQKHGIVLVLHSDIHLKEEIPSGRIFEAAASSCVIISDNNAFVKKHFGDSVLYIDTSLPGEDIFQQIADHLMRIFLDPEWALELSCKSHSIFTENFTMEKQLLNIQDSIAK